MLMTHSDGLIVGVQGLAYTIRFLHKHISLCFVHDLQLIILSVLSYSTVILIVAMVGAACGHKTWTGSVKHVNFSSRDKLLWRPPLLVLNPVTNMVALSTSLYLKKLPSRDTPCFLNPKGPKTGHSRIYKCLIKLLYMSKMWLHTMNNMLKLESSAALI